MNTETLTRGDLEITLFINTDHGNILEFVLDDAGDRANCSYYSHLMDMFTAAGVDYSEYGAYGDVYFTIKAPTLNELDLQIKTAAGVVRQWITRYNVNKMKRNK